MNFPNSSNNIIKTVLETFVDIFKNYFPDTVSIGAYPSMNRTISLPALFIELDSLEPSQQDGRTFSMMARFIGRVIFDRNYPDAYSLVALYSAHLSNALIENMRPIPYQGHIEILGCEEDFFKPELKSYLCWATEWSMKLHFGDLPPMDPSEIKTVLLSTGPYGKGNEEQYKTIYEDTDGL